MAKNFTIAIASFTDLLRPKMLALTFAPAIVGITLWVLIIFSSWPSIVGFVSGSAWLPLMMTALGLLVLLPALAVTGLALTSVLAMPVIEPYVRVTYFPELEARKGHGLLDGFKNSMLYLAIYLVLLVITLPSWFVPFLGPAVAVGLNTFVNKKILYFDSLANIATKDEYRELQKLYRKEVWGMAFILALFMLVPGYFLVAPVHAGIAYSRFSFEKLSELRKLTAVPSAKV